MYSSVFKTAYDLGCESLQGIAAGSNLYSTICMELQWLLEIFSEAPWGFASAVPSPGTQVVTLSFPFPPFSSTPSLLAAHTWRIWEQSERWEYSPLRPPYSLCAQQGVCVCSDRRGVRAELMTNPLIKPLEIYQLHNNKYKKRLLEQIKEVALLFLL